MNQLKVKEQQAIIALYEQGWSKRKIARELGLDLTVRRYIAAAGSKADPVAISTCTRNHPPRRAARSWI